MERIINRILLISVFVILRIVGMYVSGVVIDSFLPLSIWLLCTFVMCVSITGTKFGKHNCLSFERKV